LKQGSNDAIIDRMPMTLDQIVEETRQLPRVQVAELVDALTLSLHQAIEPAVEEAWKRETSCRVQEIIDGKVQGIPMEEVSESIRSIVGR
jgi:putative addiction module component (TIGR02574 family)